MLYFNYNKIEIILRCFEDVQTIMATQLYNVCKTKIQDRDNHTKQLLLLSLGIPRELVRTIMDYLYYNDPKRKQVKYLKQFNLMRFCLEKKKYYDEYPMEPGEEFLYSLYKYRNVYSYGVEDSETPNEYRWEIETEICNSCGNYLCSNVRCYGNHSHRVRCHCWVVNHPDHMHI